MISAFAGISADIWLNFIREGLTNAAVAVGAMSTAPVRRPKLFLACMILCGPLNYLTPSENLAAAWFFAGFVLNYFVVPFVFWQGPPPRRILCALLLSLWLLVAEMFAAFMFVVMGVPVVQGGIPSSAKWLMLAPQSAFIILGDSLIGRFLRSTPAMGGLFSQYPPQYYLPILLQLFAALGVAQFASNISLDDLSFYVVLSLLCVLLLFEGVAVLFSMERYSAAMLEHDREQALERMLNEALNQSHEAIAACEQSARFRHDQRNHLQVLSGLIDRGELDEARRYAHELCEALEESFEEGFLGMAESSEGTDQ